MSNKGVFNFNNFDFLRLLLSSLVIFSHSFPLSGNIEFLSGLTGGQGNFGEIAVNSFFIISGFLIIKSLQRSKSIGEYLFKRLLRIFPGLLALLIFTVFILWLFFGDDRLYGVSGAFYYVFRNMSLYYLQYSIGDIFAGNPYPAVINGSLWSLAYEFTMYLFLALLFPIRNKRLLLLGILVSVFLGVYYIYHFNPIFLQGVFGQIYLESKLVYRLSAYFIAGSILSIVDLGFLDKKGTVPLLLLLIVMTFVFQVYDIFSFLLLPPFVLLIGKAYYPVLSYIPNRTGDISYGIYIYGFLVQQLFQHFFALGPYSLFILSLAVTFALAYFSWRYVEKPFLSLKLILK